MPIKENLNNHFESICFTDQQIRHQLTQPGLEFFRFVKTENHLVMGPDEKIVHTELLQFAQENGLGKIVDAGFLTKTDQLVLIHGTSSSLIVANELSVRSIKQNRAKTADKVKSILKESDIAIEFQVE